MAMQKHQADQEERVNELADRQRKLVQQTESKIADSARRASKLPEIATMLQPFL